MLTTRVWILTLLLWGVATFVPADVAAEERPTVALVLGGGGARGAAHIGVIGVLEELHVPVDMVIGTSMGAVVGGLYAAGRDAGELEQVLRAIDWGAVRQDSPDRDQRPMRRKSEDLDLSVRYTLGLRVDGIATPPGVLYGQHLDLLLRRVLGDVRDVRDFDALGIPFRAVATDLGTGDTVVLDRGDLVEAIRASMSVPGAFAPARVGGRALLDGGVVNNVPVDVARELGADVVIAVDVGSDLPDPETVRSALAVSLAASQIMVVNRTSEVLATLGDDDVLIEVDLGTMSGAAFGDAVTAIAPGEEAARGRADVLRELSVSPGEHARWQRERRAASGPPPIVTGIVVDPSRAPQAARMVRARLRQGIGDRFDVDLLEEDLDRLYGIGRFAAIDYELQPSDGGALLVVQPLDKPWGPTLMRFGIGFADDFDGGRRYRMSVETLTHGRGTRGREWRVRADVGQPTALRVELYQPFDLRNRWFTRWRARGSQREVRFFESDQALGTIVLSELAAEGALGRNFGDDWELAAGIERGHAWLEGTSGFALLVDDDDQPLARGFVGLTHDTLDDFALPRRGRRLEVRLDAADEALGAEADNTRLEWQIDQAVSFGRRRFLLGVAGANVTSPTVNPGEVTALGGLFRLSGYRREELLGEDFLLARLIYFDTSGGGAGSVFGAPVVLGASVEYGDTWLDEELWRLDELRWAGSVFAGFDTILGSIYLGYGRAEQGRDSFYFSFGPLFGIGRNAGIDAF